TSTARMRAPRAANAKPPRPGARFGKRLRESAIGVGEFLREHLLLSVLGLLALLLIALFFIGLAILQPSSPGHQTTLSNVRALINDDRVPLAVLKDQDKRIEILTTGGRALWSPYPASDSFTSDLLNNLSKKHVVTVVQQQAGVPTLKA